MTFTKSLFIQTPLCIEVTTEISKSSEILDATSFVKFTVGMVDLVIEGY